MDEFDALLIAANKHGMESDPDHEVGDLQDILRSCWKRLTSEQKKEVYREHAELVVTWLGDGSS